MNSFSGTFMGGSFVCNIKQYLEKNRPKLWNVIYNSSCFVQDFSNHRKFLTFILLEDKFINEIIKDLKSNDKDIFLSGIQKLKGCMFYLNTNNPSKVPSTIYSYTGVIYKQKIQGNNLKLTCQMEDGTKGKELSFEKDKNFNSIGGYYNNHCVYKSKNDSQMPYLNAKKRDTLRKTSKKKEKTSDDNFYGGAVTIPNSAYDKNGKEDQKIREIFYHIFNNMENMKTTPGSNLNNTSFNNIIQGGGSPLDNDSELKDFILVDVLCCVLNYILGSNNNDKIVVTAFYCNICSSITMLLGLIMGAFGGVPIINLKDAAELHKQKWDFFGRITSKDTIYYYDYVKMAQRKLSKKAYAITNAEMFNENSEYLKDYYDYIKQNKKGNLNNKLISDGEHLSRLDSQLKVYGGTSKAKKLFGDLPKFLELEIPDIICNVILIIGFHESIITELESEAVMNNDISGLIAHITPLINLKGSSSKTGLDINLAYSNNLVLKMSLVIPYVLSNFIGKISENSYDDININNNDCSKFIIEIQKYEDKNVKNTENYKKRLGKNIKNLNNNIEGGGGNNDDNDLLTPSLNLIQNTNFNNQNNLPSNDDNVRHIEDRSLDQVIRDTELYSF